jgi:hypothetical protein
MSHATAAARPPARRTFTLEQVQDASGMQAGFCLACGAMQEECEPDARQCKCDACGERHVYGAEEVLMMGLVT